MGSIRESITKNGKKSFHALIRKRGNKTIVKTFRDLETAKLFLWYKEKIIEEMAAFEVPMSQLISLQDGYEIKKATASRENRHAKYCSDLEVDFKSISEWIPAGTLLKEIKFQQLDSMIKGMNKTTVFRGGTPGGKGERTGKEVQISPNTMRRRLTALSTIYNTANAETGANLINPVTAYMPVFRKQYLNKP